MKQLQRVEFGAYFRAFAHLARNPVLILPPLLMALAGVALTQVAFGGDGGFGGGIAGLIVRLLDGFGLGVALILADTVWRRGSASFEPGWDEGRRKAGDILMAVLAVSFILYVAQIIGGVLGGLGAAVLGAVAFYFLVYTIPAASIGGIPGGASAQVSIERVQRTYLGTFVLVVVMLLAYTWIPIGITLLLAPLALGGSIVTQLILAVAKAVAVGYIALVLAKAYNDASYGRF